jgi:hypothetical protein
MGRKSLKELSKLLRNWDLYFIDAIGRLGGNVTGWNKCSFTLTNSWAFPIGLGTSFFSLDLGKDITVLNVYGPYMDRMDYWDRFFKMDSVQNGLL